MNRDQYVLQRFAHVAGHYDFEDPPEDDVCVHGILFSEECEECESDDE